jgi:fumarate hydratase subunit beta
MASTHRLRLPLGEAAIRALAPEDQVLLDGEIVVTIGQPTHQRIVEWLAAGRPLPVNVRGGAFFHLSCFNRERGGGFEALYMNPTTSTRLAAFMPAIIRGLGPRLVGGKGGLDAACVEAMREAGCAYLSFLGGGNVLHAEAIRGVVAVHWTDLIPQFRLVVLRVEGLAGTVAIDAHGNSIYARLRDSANERLPRIFEALGARRAGKASGIEPMIR